MILWCKYDGKVIILDENVRVLFIAAAWIRQKILPGGWGLRCAGSSNLSCISYIHVYTGDIF